MGEREGERKGGGEGEGEGGGSGRVNMGRGARGSSDIERPQRHHWNSRGHKSVDFICCSCPGDSAIVPPPEGSRGNASKAGTRGGGGGLGVGGTL